MSYYTYVEGEFAIVPPLTWDEIRRSPFERASQPAYLADGIDLLLRVEEAPVETDEGTLVRRAGVALVMREIDEYREENLADQVQRVIDMFPGHTFIGRLDGEGQYNSDMWRIIIRQGRAMKVKAQIVWPDGAE